MTKQTRLHVIRCQQYIIPSRKGQTGSTALHKFVNLRKIGWKGVKKVIAVHPSLEFPDAQSQVTVVDKKLVRVTILKVNHDWTASSVNVCAWQRNVEINNYLDIDLALVSQKM